tara:strand:- start:4285 stop:5142 length:858 start_codon:yes stop_codon:yes gene_type:complete
MKVIGFGSDHNGTEVKNQLIEKLLKNSDFFGYRFIDFGNYDSKIKSDYTDVSKQIGSLVSGGQLDFGILICGTGVGMSIVANKIKGCRAALIHNTFSAPKSKEHNNSNILCLGAWVNDINTNYDICNLWLNEDFGEGRHVRRVEKIEKNPLYKSCFTYGCFDLLTTTHIKLLEWSKELSNKLIVGLMSDDFTKKLKGEHRPYLAFQDRKKILNSLDCVDEIIELGEDISETLNIIKPDLIVKGGNSNESEIRKIDKIPNDYDLKIFPYIEENDQIKELISNARKD